MNEEPASHAGDVAGYSYPADLARFVRDRWGDPPAGSADDGLPRDPTILEHFFSACYQASLLREEERPVTFRAVLAPPTRFPAQGIPPESLQRLEFSRNLPFDAMELKRLSGAEGVPVVTLGAQPLLAFNPDDWNNALDATGYPQTSMLPRNFKQEPARPLTQKATPPPAAQ